MIIKETKYVICSKYYPIEFESDFSGVMTENFKDSYLYSDMSEAEDGLCKFDEPDKFQIRSVILEIQI